MKQDVNANKLNCRQLASITPGSETYTSAVCNYFYAGGQDTSQIDFQSYKLAITFENKDNINNQARRTIDGGTHANGTTGT